MNNILLVEDDVFIAEIYMKKLTGEGFSVDNAVTGREVLKRVQEKPYDLILLDLVLPEMGGMDVLRELRGKPTEYPGDYKIVVFSNLSSADDRSQAVKVGADGFISKTEFTPSQVVDEVKRYLKQFSEQTKHATQQESGEERTTGPVTASKRESILLVEDEKIFADMFSKRLADEGYTVTVKGNGLDAFEIAEREPFDLIITDVMLPGMEGRELIGKLRERPATKDTPVFVLTASLNEQEMSFLRASGTVTEAFLKTQITPSELTDAVTAFFNAKP